MYQKRYKVSIVNYLNTLPFVYGIKQCGFDKHVDFSYDVPSVCASKLLSGEVDIGLVPVAILNELNPYYIITDFCIGASDKVDSVKLFSKVPLEEIEKVYLDYQSRTSVALVQILAKEFWHIKPEFVSGGPGFENNIEGTTAAVVIGDRTFPMINTYPFEYDLAEEWKKMTGLPFAFAAWTSRVQINDPTFINDFNATLKFGIDNVNEALRNYVNSYSEFDPLEYLTKRIDHRLDSSKNEAITLFLEKLNNFNFKK